MTQGIDHKVSGKFNLRERKSLLLILSLLALIGLWEVLIIVLHVPKFILPAPRLIIKYFLEGLLRGSLLPHLWTTVFEILVGFALAAFAGVFLAVVVSRSRFLNLLIHPYVVAFQATPKVAIAPLFIMWFGFGVFSKILIVAAIAFFPMFVNTVTGLESLSVKMLDLMNSYSATKWQIFWKARVPNALPYVFAGLEIGITLSLIGALVGEFVGATGGLGYLLVLWQNQLDTERVFAIILLLVILGVVLYLLTAMIKKYFLFWSEKV